MSQERAAASENVVFIRNLARNLEVGALEAHLTALKLKASVSSSEGSRGPKGFALLTFQDGPSAARALEKLNGSFIADREVFARLDRGARVAGAQSERDGGNPRAKPRRERTERKADGAEVNQAALFVGNLSFDADEDGLRELFGPYGTVVNAEVVRGWGTVEMSSSAEAQAAIEGLNGVEHLGRSLNIEVRKGRAKSGRERKGRTNEDASSKPGRERKAPANDADLFVGNLSFDADEDGLRELFGPYGTVVNAQVVRGWGTVEMSSSAEAQAAIDGLNGVEHLGRSLNIEVRKGLAKSGRERKGPGRR